MNKNQLETNQCYVASLDLLGVKSLILNDSSNKHLNHIHNIYTSWEKIRKSDNYFGNVKVKIFSDNIVIAVDSSISDGLEILLEYVSDMAEHFLECNYKIRGGISKGSFYVDDIMVWGAGLVNAYLLESENAVVPRVLIDNSLLENITKRTRDYLIVQDKDGQFYLNYLRYYGKNRSGYLKTIYSAKKNLELEYQSNLNIKIIQKLDWFKNYLDSEERYWNTQK